MSTLVKDRAVVLRTFDFGESSTIAVALMRDHGKVRLLAKGARKKNSPYLGRLRTGNLVEVVFYYKEHRGLQLLREVSSESFDMPGRSDFERLCIFQAGLEVIDRATIERESDAGQFMALEAFIVGLPSCPDPWAAFFTLEVQLLKRLGFYPDLTGCSRCGRAAAGASLVVDTASGSVTCVSCCGRGDLKLTEETCEILGRMERAGSQAMTDITLDRAMRRRVGTLLHNLFLHHIDGYRLPYALRLLKEDEAQ
ncbi:MAG: DNA repair protein RecO [bacterium]|nr:MAG: DNA repair protein RecO [bacterium]